MNKEILIILGLVIAVVAAVLFMDFARRQDKPEVVVAPEVIDRQEDALAQADIKMPKAYRLGEVPYEETPQFTGTPPPAKVRDYVKGG